MSCLDIYWRYKRRRECKGEQQKRRPSPNAASLGKHTYSVCRFDANVAKFSISVRASRPVNDKVVAVRDGLGEALVRRELDGAYPVVVFGFDGPGVGWHWADVLHGFPAETEIAELPSGADGDDAKFGRPARLCAEVETFVPEASPVNVLVVVDAEVDAELGGFRAVLGRRLVGFRFAGMEGDGGCGNGGQSEKS